ncbi:class I adenylate-forming enzyme family protein [Phenylobacterium sp.]|uniref:class I adenylate-forming enzyme family protein n=1 Tax=Phenylobacterium sp. TaxID=1871053 RepID=UPI00301DF979
MFDGPIRDHAGWTPRATAIVTPGGTFTYAQVNADVDRCAAALAELELRPGQVVSVALAAPYIQLVATAALARLGVASSPAGDWGADARLSDAHLSDGHVPPGGSPEGSSVHRIDEAWLRAMYAREPRPWPSRAYAPLDLGRVMLSSGTTGRPRRVGYTWRRIEHGNHLSLRSYGGGRLGAWIPLVSIDAMMGLTMAMCGWAVGAAVTASFEADDLPRWLERLESGIVAMTPIQLRRVLDALPPGFRPTPRWRLMVGGAVLPPETAREARARITPDIRTLYGSTEGGAGGQGLASGLDDAPGQVGITPSGAIVTIVGEDGRPVPEGQSGEVRIRGPRVIQGYLGDPEADAERFRDGWYLTGDIGHRLPDGRLVLEGRRDDRMNLGGLKIMPAVLEAAALSCPGVRDCAAFAVPTPDGLDACWLAVVAEPGFDGGRLTRHLAGHGDLPAPRYAWTRDIPRNAMGKVDRNALREAVLAATRPPAAGKAPDV